MKEDVDLTVVAACVAEFIGLVSREGGEGLVVKKGSVWLKRWEVELPVAAPAIKIELEVGHDAPGYGSRDWLVYIAISRRTARDAALGDGPGRELGAWED